MAGRFMIPTIPHQFMYNSVHAFCSILRKLQVFKGKTKQVKEITDTECWLFVEKESIVLKAE